MRAFIGINLPSDVKDRIYELQKQIGGDLAKIRWVHKKNLHLTLKFFADIPEPDAKKAGALLKEIKFKPFKVKLGKLGFFPAETRIRIIWIDLEPAKDIMNLQGEIDEKLSRMFAREKQFKVHLSLGRVKLIKNKEKFIRKLNEIKIPDAEFEISEFKFIESKLTKDGPIYSVMEGM